MSRDSQRPFETPGTLPEQATRRGAAGGAAHDAGKPAVQDGGGEGAALRALPAAGREHAGPLRLPHSGSRRRRQPRPHVQACPLSPLSAFLAPHSPLSAFSAPLSPLSALPAPLSPPSAQIYDVKGAPDAKSGICLPVLLVSSYFRHFGEV